MLLAPSGPGEDFPPGTRGGRSQCHLVSDTSQRRLILLMAGLAVMRTNTTSHSSVLPDTPPADVAVSSTEGLHSGCFWLLTLFPWVFLPSSK